jgi:hypothetical protein
MRHIALILLALQGAGCSYLEELRASRESFMESQVVFADSLGQLAEAERTAITAQRDAERLREELAVEAEAKVEAERALAAASEEEAEAAALALAVAAQREADARALLAQADEAAEAHRVAAEEANGRVAAAEERLRLSTIELDEAEEPIHKGVDVVEGVGESIGWAIPSIGFAAPLLAAIAGALFARRERNKQNA